MPTITGDPYFLRVEPLSSGRTGVPYDSEGNREYTQKWSVWTKQKGVGVIRVCNAPYIPIYMSPYVSQPDQSESDLLALLVNKSAEQEDQQEGEWYRWTVTCKYSSRLPASGVPQSPGSPDGGGMNGEPPSVDGGGIGNGTGGGGGNNGSINNPELEPPVIEWDWEVAQRPMETDLDGKPIVNSAKQPFSPPPLFEVAMPLLTLERNELGFNRATATKYAFVVNSDMFLGVGPGGVMSYPPKAKQVSKGGLVYWRVSYKLKFHWLIAEGGGGGSFDPIKLLDIGTKRIQDVAGRPDFGKAIPIRHGPHPTSTPVLLDGRGQPKRPNGAGIIFPEYLRFRVRESQPFNVLIQYGVALPL